MAEIAFPIYLCEDTRNKDLPPRYTTTIYTGSTDAVQFNHHEFTRFTIVDGSADRVKYAVGTFGTTSNTVFILQDDFTDIDLAEMLVMVLRSRFKDTSYAHPVLFEYVPSKPSTGKFIGEFTIASKVKCRG